MQNTTKYNNISVKNALSMPETKGIAENMLKNKQAIHRQVLASEKYLKSSELATRLYFNELVQKHPDWNLKEIFVAVVQTFPDEMPPKVMLNMTQIIFEEWEKIKLDEAIAA